MLKAFLWANTTQKASKAKNDKKSAFMLFNDALFKPSP
ncbi:Hypothetical protein HPV225_0334 [Helicobacter pylori v225d]|nr:Hypothetical protein HPV225_0334 [Helicobacter pylori v225d]